MKFKLDFEIPASKQQISIKKPILLAGSCFAEHIGNRLQTSKFNVVLNPNGILFNPISICKSIVDIVEESIPSGLDLFEYNGVWYSWQHHGKFNAPTKEVLFERIVKERKEALEQFKNADWLVITFGSAWVYELKDSHHIVANCHKVPQKQFNKRLLTIEEISNACKSILEHEKLKNKKILFTVSPVRYIRDGLVENNRSKAHLLSAVHQICSTYSNAYYFPAYEIVLDELRDYRFFEKDMVHPNELAIDYVFEKFVETYVDAETQLFIKNWTEIQLAMHHRPIHPESNQHKEFIRSYQSKLDQMIIKYPELNLKLH